MNRQKLLVIEPLVGIGDLIWHKPWLDWLAGRFDLWLLAKPTCRAEVILHDTVRPDQILPLDRSLRGRKGRHDGCIGFMRLIADIRHIQADRLLLLHHSGRYALAAALAGIPARAGYGFGMQRRFLNEGAFLPPALLKAHPTHKLEHYAARNHWPMPEPSWCLHLCPAALAQARSWLGPAKMPYRKPARKPARKPDRKLQTGLQKDGAGSSGRCLLMGIGAMSEARRWPLHYFCELLCLLARDRPDLQIIVTGGPEDKLAAEEIVSSLESWQKPRLLFDSLAVAIACQSLVDGYVGNDTSLLNIAAALGKPALGFFSQSPPMSWSRHFYHTGQIAEDEFGQPGIISKITPAAVLQRIDEIWPPAGGPEAAQT